MRDLVRARVAVLFGRSTDDEEATASPSPVLHAAHISGGKKEYDEPA